VAIPCFALRAILCDVETIVLVHRCNNVRVLSTRLTYNKFMSSLLNKSSKTFSVLTLSQ